MSKESADILVFDPRPSRVKMIVFTFIFKDRLCQPGRQVVG